jgi:hypothetical protein
LLWLGKFAFGWLRINLELAKGCKALQIEEI